MKSPFKISFDTSLGAVKRFISTCQRKKTHGTLWKSQCWIWPDPEINFIYKGKSINPVDFTYLAFKGPLADQDRFKHLCKNKRCVNPLHIRKIRKRVWSAQKAKIPPIPLTKQRGSIEEYPPFNHQHFWNSIRQEGYHLVGPSKYRINGLIGVKPIRLAYMLKIGPIPDNHLVMAKCDNPNCIDPYHCEIEPIKRGKEKSAI